MGVVFVRHGKKHDVYKQPLTKIETTVPRHDEIKEFTTRNENANVRTLAAFASTVIVVMALEFSPFFRYHF